MTVWEEFRSTICWNIDDGVTTNFWYDNWLNVEGALAIHCTGHELPKPATVASYVTESGECNWSELEKLLLSHILRRISAIIPPNPMLGRDTPTWRWEET
ncbi:hypothetical protein V6N12_064845 [Hibiscus sabdariffa]|uniref:Reverse transcriptase zinc-binding domain-containing protein n=1 Tax=Hibiscus sabdariffa TaxID=183260 RepID=A0ABR2G6Z0_9ROSI